MGKVVALGGFDVLVMYALEDRWWVFYTGLEWVCAWSVVGDNLHALLD